ncbi:MAG: RNA methyltransferase [Thermoguttaceae bacterium]
MNNAATITSLQNPRIKDAVRLRDRRQRVKQGRILIDGVRELQRAIDAGVTLAEAFVCEPLCRTSEAKRLLAELPGSGAELLAVSEPVFEKLAFGQRAEGVLGVAEMPRPTLASVAEQIIAPRPAVAPAVIKPRLVVAPDALPQNAIVAVLEGVEKPGNVGAVLRSADAAGLSAVILADPRTDLYNPNAIRSSLGTIFTMPVCEAASSEVLAWLREHDFSIVAARVDGSVPYTQVDYRGPTALVLGSEAEGLTAAWSGEGITAVRLPMLGIADSLNVSVTAAVLFYEALRQRQM